VHRQFVGDPAGTYDMELSEAENRTCGCFYFTMTVVVVSKHDDFFRYDQKERVAYPMHLPKMIRWRPRP
jgi:hypothetical protein